MREGEQLVCTEGGRLGVGVRTGRVALSSLWVLVERFGSVTLHNEERMVKISVR